MVNRHLIAAACAGILAGPVGAQEAYFGYDAFPAPQISFDKWLFGERTRQIVGGSLIMFQRDYGDQASDSGTRRSIWPIDLRNPQPVRQLRASVMMTQYDVVGCAHNGSPTNVQARVIGKFFNVGSPVEGDETGDVIALARLIRRSNDAAGPGVIAVQGLAVQCTNADCTASSVLGSVQDLGTVALNTFVRLAIEWDPAVKTFYFQRDSQPKASVTYAVDDVNPPGLRFQRLDTRTETANCLSGVQTTATVGAKFDAVQVNLSAMP